MRSRQELIDRQSRLQGAYQEAQQELMRFPGVVGVGIGLKRTGGKLTDEICFRVYVDEKKDLRELSAEKIIPAEIKDILTDVIEVVGEIGLLVDPQCENENEDEEKYSPLKGGIQISNSKNRGNNMGTLGCFATLNSDGRTVVLLSNYHVLYKDVGGPNNENCSQKPEEQVEIGQPKYKDCICCTSHVIGKTEHGCKNQQVDCAIARITSDRGVKNEIVDIGPLAGIAPRTNENGSLQFIRAVAGEIVFKRGRSTRKTAGIVEEVNFTHIRPSTGEVLAVNQILVTPSDEQGNRFEPDADGIFAQKFVCDGDSGSVLVNTKNQVVGLVFASRQVPKFVQVVNREVLFSSGQGLANHIELVQAAMGITIFPATGTGGETVATSERPGLTGAPGEENFSPNIFFRRLEQDLQQSANGRMVIKLALRHENEIRELINNNRHVMVTWHRNQGPQFVAAWIQSGQNPAEKFPKEMNNIALQTLLIKMCAVLDEYGSELLSTSIRRHSLALLNYASDCDSIDDLLFRIHHSQDLLAESREDISVS